MNRRTFLRNLAYTVPTAAVLPHFTSLAAKEAKSVKITDVKCVLTMLNFRVSPLVKIETDAGIVGYGECHHDKNVLGAKDIVLNVCKPILLGQDPFDLERLVFKMSTRTSYYGGNHGVATHAITGVEFAMWDIIGKVTGQPVHKLLGGGSHVDQVRAYVSGGPRDKLNKDDCAEYADRMHSGGWTAGKIGITRDQRWNQLDNRRISNRELDENEEGYANVRERWVATLISLFIVIGNLILIPPCGWHVPLSLFGHGGWKIRYPLNSMSNGCG
ncbi:hypothetical protein F7C95_04065 [Opitutia bacterium ISCC 51]|nr:hypothetical protein F7C95_04065 [Opitutae bacterium ISCC 51]QXD29157.1 hypothetical protein GA003_04045 [Opitutae bacterium ISCC 52]